MAESSWEDMLESSQKTALLQDGRRKVHYTFPNGTELVEEYDSKTSELLLRKWKKKGTLGDSKPWDIEVGEVQMMGQQFKDSMIMESTSNPVVVRRDKLDSFQWRIRNLQYTIDVYKLSVEDNKIVVRTTNKKYFKKIEVPDLERLSINLDPANLTYAHANNTLLIVYKKPVEVVEFESKLMKRLKKLKSDGDVDQCKQQ